MPCALTEPDNYPDYLKKILKEIDVGSDDELKDCACDLKSLVDDEGCLIVDENNKIGGFPFCIAEGNNVGPTTPRPLGFSMKQIMRMYWLGFNMNIDVFVNTSLTATYCDNTSDNGPLITSGSKNVSFEFNKTLKQKICLGNEMFHGKNYVITRWPDTNNIQSTFDLAIYLDSSMVYKSDVKLFYPIILFSFFTGGGEYRAVYINDDVGINLGNSIFSIEGVEYTLPNVWGDLGNACNLLAARVALEPQGALFLNSKININ